MGRRPLAWNSCSLTALARMLSTWAEIPNPGLVRSRVRVSRSPQTAPQGQALGYTVPGKVLLKKTTRQGGPCPLAQTHVPDGGVLLPQGKAAMLIVFSSSVPPGHLPPGCQRVPRQPPSRTARSGTNLSSQAENAAGGTNA